MEWSDEKVREALDWALDNGWTKSRVRDAIDEIVEKQATDEDGDAELFPQLLKFLRVYRKFWLVPIVLLLIVVGSLIVAVQSSAIAPFIYALF